LIAVPVGSVSDLLNDADLTHRSNTLRYINLQGECSTIGGVNQDWRSLCGYIGIEIGEVDVTLPPVRTPLRLLGGVTLAPGGFGIPLQDFYRRSGLVYDKTLDGHTRRLVHAGLSTICLPVDHYMLEMFRVLATLLPEVVHMNPHLIDILHDPDESMPTTTALRGLWYMSWLTHTELHAYVKRRPDDQDPEPAQVSSSTLINTLIPDEHVWSNCQKWILGWGSENHAPLWTTRDSCRTDRNTTRLRSFFRLGAAWCKLR